MAFFRRDDRRLTRLAIVTVGFLLAILVYSRREYVTATRWTAPKQSDTEIVQDPLSEQVDQPKGLVGTGIRTSIPSTILPESGARQSAFVQGFTLLDTLYVRNGTFYVVTDDPDFPPRDKLVEKPLPLSEGLDHTPTDEDLQIITPAQAREVLGEFATRVTGFTVFVYDPEQFMHHFYHWWGEIIIGMWRVYSSLAPTHNIPLPSRFVLPVITGEEWRDRAGLIGPLMRAAFPETSIEKADYWKDLSKLGTTFVFDRAMIINRSLAHKHPFSGKWFKMMAGTMSVIAPEHFWEPIRKSMVLNTIGYVPSIDSRGRVLRDSLHPSTVPLPSDKGDRYALPVVTYISRQSAGRRLVDKDHQLLVESLRALEAEGLCTLQIPVMERLSIREQAALIATTTILVGVHGNGLTHQLIMPPSLRSAVFEILDPPSYTFDYEMLARNMGHKHYAVHNDTLVTFPKGQPHEGVHFTDGFHGDSIHVYGPVIADMIKLRLTQADEAVQD